VKLTEDQYNRLKPFRPLLDLFGQTGQLVSSSGNETFVSIHKELDPSSSGCITCGGEIVAICRRLNDFIKEYESKL
jgi:hypothetical protein